MSVEMKSSGDALLASGLTSEATDQLADKRIIKQIMVCILIMMGIAVAKFTTANSIA